MSGGLDRHLMSVAGVVVLGAIMSILDTTVVNVAIATLARDFDASLATIQWVATAYLLSLATVIPLTGWAADRFGTKRLYMLSIALFVGGSALYGLAWSSASLIAFRAFQGLGGGMIMPVGMTILNQAAGPRRVGRMMSVVGVAAMLAPLLGPVLGGWIVEDFSAPGPSRMPAVPGQRRGRRRPRCGAETAGGPATCRRAPPERAP
jgi:MFS family permease